MDALDIAILAGCFTLLLVLGCQLGYLYIRAFFDALASFTAASRRVAEVARRPLPPSRDRV